MGIISNYIAELLKNKKNNARAFDSATIKTVPLPEGQNFLKFRDDEQMEFKESVTELAITFPITDWNFGANSSLQQVVDTFQAIQDRVLPEIEAGIEEYKNSNPSATTSSIKSAEFMARNYAFNFIQISFPQITQQFFYEILLDVQRSGNPPDFEQVAAQVDKKLSTFIRSDLDVNEYPTNKMAHYSIILGDEKFLEVLKNHLTNLYNGDQERVEQAIENLIPRIEASKNEIIAQAEGLNRSQRSAGAVKNPNSPEIEKPKKGFGERLKGLFSKTANARQELTRESPQSLRSPSSTIVKNGNESREEKLRQERAKKINESGSMIQAPRKPSRS